MRLLTLTTLYPNAAMPTFGLFVEARLRRLIETGEVSARVVAPVPWFPLRSARAPHYAAFAATPREECRHGIPIFHPRYWVIPKIGLRLQPMSYFSAARRAVERLCAAGFAFDLIDAHYAFPDGVAAARLGRKLGKPVVVTARGTDLNLIAALPGPGRAIRKAFHAIDRLITVSAALKERALSLGMPAERIAVLRNGVDLDFFRPVDGTAWRAGLPAGAALVASVGNLVPLKGHDLVIRALTNLDNAHLLIVGGGPERERLEALSRALGLAARVRIAGPLEQSALPMVYSAADALVLASEREGWPNVLLEAMACGTPVVATRAGGIPEIVTAPEAGILLDTRSADAIAAGLKRLLGNRPPRASVRAHAQKFSWDDTIARQIALYREVIDGWPARQGA